MALATWLNPPNFLEAIRSGASTGTALRGQDIGAREAQDRLGLAYDQMAQSAAEHQATIAAQREQQQAGLALRAQQASALQAYQQQQQRQQQLQQDALNEYRQQQVEETARRDAFTQQKESAAEALQTGIQKDTAGFFAGLNQPGTPVTDDAGDTDLPERAPIPTAAQLMALNPLSSRDVGARQVLADELRTQREKDKENFDLGSQDVTEVLDPKTGDLLGHRTLIGPNRGEFIPLSKIKSEAVLTPSQTLTGLLRSSGEALKASGGDTSSPLYNSATNSLQRALDLLQPKTAGKVRVVAPDGITTGTIPESELAAAIKEGYKRAE